MILTQRLDVEFSLRFSLTHPLATTGREIRTWNAVAKQEGECKKIPTRAHC